jgi:hypothetical protein
VSAEILVARARAQAALAAGARAGSMAEPKGLACEGCRRALQHWRRRLGAEAVDVGI